MLPGVSNGENLSMNNQIKYSLAGFCMGVAELIQGISGATVAVILRSIQT